MEAALGVLTLHAAGGARLAHTPRHVLKAGRGTPGHTRPLLGQVAAWWKRREVTGMDVTV